MSKIILSIYFQKADRCSLWILAFSLLIFSVLFLPYLLHFVIFIFKLFIFRWRSLVIHESDACLSCFPGMFSERVWEREVL